MIKNINTSWLQNVVSHMKSLTRFGDMTGLIGETRSTGAQGSQCMTGSTEETGSTSAQGSQDVALLLMENVV
jgi:hypothetical protein